jgi:hypothetical protein
MPVYVDTAEVVWSAAPWRQLDANTRDDLHVLALTFGPRHEGLQDRVFHRRADITVAKHLETTKLNAARRAAHSHGLRPAPETGAPSSWPDGDRHGAAPASDAP